ncbi:hypothetical protein DAI22_05g249450 [Oryza sativa Japonica Group]|nr:hypothetical protein DAI22_05g249450 [Oryza sativa Japonica Group]
MKIPILNFPKAPPRSSLVVGAGAVDGEPQVPRGARLCWRKISKREDPEFQTMAVLPHLATGERGRGREETHKKSPKQRWRISSTAAGGETTNSSPKKSQQETHQENTHKVLTFRSPARAAAQEPPSHRQTHAVRRRGRKKPMRIRRPPSSVATVTHESSGRRPWERPGRNGSAGSTRIRPPPLSGAAAVGLGGRERVATAVAVAETAGRWRRRSGCRGGGAAHPKGKRDGGEESGAGEGREKGDRGDGGESQRGGERGGGVGRGPATDSTTRQGRT